MERRGGQGAGWRPRAGRWLRQGAGDLLHLIAPPRCGSCEVALAHAVAVSLCARCWPALRCHDGPRCPRCDARAAGTCGRCRARPPAYGSLRAPYRYEGVLAALICRFKLGPEPRLGPLLAALLATSPAARALAAGASALVPVPMPPARLRARGIDHARILATHLARAWGLPLRRCLRREDGAAPQRALRLAARRRNVQEGFVASAAISGTPLLVDDVVTSGATLDAAAHALRVAGAEGVRAVAIARALRDA